MLSLSSCGDLISFKKAQMKQANFKEVIVGIAINERRLC